MTLYMQVNVITCRRMTLLQLNDIIYASECHHNYAGEWHHMTLLFEQGYDINPTLPGIELTTSQPILLGYSDGYEGGE